VLPALTQELTPSEGEMAGASLLNHLLRHKIQAGPQGHGQPLWIGGRKLGSSTQAHIMLFPQLHFSHTTTGMRCSQRLDLFRSRAFRSVMGLIGICRRLSCMCVFPWPFLTSVYEIPERCIRGKTRVSALWAHPGNSRRNSQPPDGRTGGKDNEVHMGTTLC